MELNERDFEATSPFHDDLQRLHEEGKSELRSCRRNLPGQLAIMHLGGIAATVTMGATATAGAVHVEASKAAGLFGCGLAFIVLCMFLEYFGVFWRVLLTSAAIKKMDRRIGKPVNLDQRSTDSLTIVIPILCLLVASAYLFVRGAVYLAHSVSGTLI